LEQFVQRIHLARDGCRAEVIHVLERDVHAQIAFASERIGNLEGHARLDRLQTAVEIIDIDIQKLSIRHRGQGLRRLAGQVREHGHDEWQLDLLLGPVDFHVILDLHARCAIAGDELLTAFFGHVTPPHTCRLVAIPGNPVSRTRDYFLSRTPPAAFAASSASGTMSCSTSRKFLAMSRLARSMNSGTGLDGSVFSKKVITASSARMASSRVRIAPTAPGAAAPLPAATPSLGAASGRAAICACTIS